MKPEAQRIAIAKAVFEVIKAREGLTPHQRKDHSLLYGGLDSFGLWIWQRADGSFYGMNYSTREKLEEGSPEEIALRNDYPGDLNAMHEAEKMLNDVQFGEYVATLQERFVPVLACDRAVCTAAQRAEAFLKTIGKWKEQP